MMRRTVVVVEDEPLVRLNATTLFEDAGIDVVEFSNGDDAINYVRDHKDHVAAIFTDVYLAGDTSGLELAGIVAEVCPEIAVLVTSGQILRLPDELHPHVRYVTKPWLPTDVLASMRNVLSIAA